MTMVETYSTSRAARLSGLSPQMLDYLVRQKILMPSGDPKRGPGRGRPRNYTFGDLVVLRTIGKFLSKGVSVERIKRAIKYLAKDSGKIGPDCLPGKFLVTDGAKLYCYADNRKKLIDLSEGGQYAFAFVLEIGQLRDEVLEKTSRDAHGSTRSKGVK